MMLFLKAQLTKDSTEGLRISILKRSKLNCRKINCLILVNGVLLWFQVAPCDRYQWNNDTILPGNDSDIRPIDEKF